MRDFACRLPDVTTQSDALAAFREELKRLREAAGLSYAEAGRKAGISGQRWRVIEAGYEQKAGVQIPANPRRDNLIKMARAVGMPVSEALRLAGMATLTTAESCRVASDPRKELTLLMATMPESRLWLLVHVARAMVDPAADLDVAFEPDPRTRTFEHIVEGPDVDDADEGNDEDTADKRNETH